MAFNVQGRQWVDGSFVENCEIQRGRPPGDIDVVTFGLLTDDIADVLPLVFLDNKESKVIFKVDHFLVPMITDALAAVEVIRYWCGLFSHRKSDDLWKGMLAVELPCSTEQAAISHLGTLSWTN